MKEAEIILEAEKRERTKKSALTALRAKGFVPAVLYGQGHKALSLSVEEKKLLKALRTEKGLNVVIQLAVENEKSRPVLVRGIQRNLIRRGIRHVDFYQISLTEKIEVALPIEVKGEAPGVKNSGGVLDHILREIRIRCLPTQIPKSAIASISSLEIGHGLRVKDLQLPKGVEVLAGPDAIVLNVSAPTILEEAVVAAEALPTAAEPEVISRGKKEEEGVAPATPAGKTAAQASPAAPAVPQVAKKEPPKKQ